MASFRGILNSFSPLTSPTFAGNPNPAPDADPHFEQPSQLEPSALWWPHNLLARSYRVIQSDTEATSSIRQRSSHNRRRVCRDVRRVICQTRFSPGPGRSGAPPRGRTIRSEAQRSHTAPDPCAKKRLRTALIASMDNGQCSNALYGPPVRYDVTR